MVNVDMILTGEDIVIFVCLDVIIYRVYSTIYIFSLILFYFNSLFLLFNILLSLTN